MNRLLVIAAFASVLSNGQAIADALSRHIITGITPGWHDGRTDGFAADVMRDFQTYSGERFDLDVLPLRRTIALYLDKQTDCLLGGDAKAIAAFKPMNGVYSLPFRSAGIVIYSLAGRREPIHNYDEARHVRLGLEAGFDFHVLLDRLPGLAQDATSAESQVKKLRAGRIDAYVGLFPPSNKYGAQVAYDPGFMLMQWTDTLHCKAEKNNEAFIQSFNAFLTEYEKRSALRQTYDKYFVPSTWINPLTAK